MWMLKIYKFIMKSTPKYRWIHQWSNKWQFLLLEYELEKGAEVSQIIWVRTQISCLSTYSNIWWRWLEAEIVDLSIISEFRLGFVLIYVWWRRGLNISWYCSITVTKPIDLIKKNSPCSKVTMQHKQPPITLLWSMVIYTIWAINSSVKDLLWISVSLLKFRKE